MLNGSLNPVNPMTIGKAIRSTAVVALLGAVTVSAQQDIRITQEVMTTNPLGGPGPGGGGRVGSAPFTCRT